MLSLLKWNYISKCWITGESIAEKDKCKQCKGKKVTNESKILEVHVDKGMKDGQKIPFRGEGDQLVGGIFPRELGGGRGPYKQSAR